VGQTNDGWALASGVLSHALAIAQKLGVIYTFCGIRNALKPMKLTLTIELDREEDGRWIAEVLEIGGALVYGATQEEAINKVAALSLRAIAERIEHGEPMPGIQTRSDAGLPDVSFEYVNAAA
jgi:predicted RNase H-like HicB family nuclease